MNLKSICLILALVPAIASAQAPRGAAEVLLVTGVAKVGARALSAGDRIKSGDTVVTGTNSYANLRFADGGRVLLRPQTEFTIEGYEFSSAAPVTGAAPAKAAAPEVPGAVAPPPGQNAFFRLARGGFRAVSGLIGQGDKAAYRVTTPHATIGIRGTDYELQMCAADCPNAGASAQGEPVLVAATDLSGLQLAQAGGAADGGLVVATHEGGVVLETTRGQFNVDAGQVVLARANGEVLQLPSIPDAMLTYPTPSPEACR